MQEVGTLIIGAGVSGLSYAAYTNEDYIIVEKENTPGGLCRTIYRDGFVWDFGGHFFHFARPELKRDFEKEINAEDIVWHVKNTNINYNGYIVDYPFQMNIHQLPKTEFIDCLFDLFNRTEKPGYGSFEEMLYGKFGKSITEKFLKPYNEKLYACDLNELDPDAMGRFFPYASPRQIINNMKTTVDQSYNSRFCYARSGAQYFIDLLLKKIKLEKLATDTLVSDVDIDKHIAVVGGKKYQYKKLVNTMPLNHFVKLIDPKYSSIVDGFLSCNKVLVLNLGFDRQAFNTQTHWTYVPMKNTIFYRMGYYSNILGADRLSMYIEIGYPEHASVDVEEQLRLTLDYLKEMGVIGEHKLIAYSAVIINPAYVHITTKSIEKVDSLRKVLEEKAAYTIGRYGSWTYCSIEDCMVDAVNLAQKG